MFRGNAPGLVNKKKSAGELLSMSQSFLFFAPPISFARRPLAACSQGQEEFELSDSVIRLTLALSCPFTKRHKQAARRNRRARCIRLLRRLRQTAATAAAASPTPSFLRRRSLLRRHSRSRSNSTKTPSAPWPSLARTPEEVHPPPRTKSRRRRKRRETAGSSLPAPWTQRRAPSAARARAGARPACRRGSTSSPGTPAGSRSARAGPTCRRGCSRRLEEVPLRREPRSRRSRRACSTPVTGRTP